VRRREFITLIGSAAVWPLVSQAQEAGRTYRLGVLVPTVSRQAPPVLALLDELRRNGFVEGQNLTLVFGGFEIANEQLPEAAAALVKAAPDVIVAGPQLPLRALQAATRTIPLVGMSEDMVAEGLVTSLAHPGGNITGISLLSPELDGKRQDILIEAVPGTRRIAAMADANATPPYHLQMLQHGARSRGVELSVFAVGGPEEIAAAIEAAKAAGGRGIEFLGDAAVLGSGQPRQPDRHGTHRGSAPASDLPMARNRGSRRACRLRPTLCRHVPSTGANCREDLARRQACRHSGGNPRSLRVGHQSPGR